MRDLIDKINKNCELKNKCYEAFNLLESIWVYAHSVNDTDLIDLITSSTDLFEGYNENIYQENQQVMNDIKSGKLFEELGISNKVF